MPRTVAAGLLTTFRTASAAEPLWMVSIPTGLTSPATLRYSTAPYSVTWGSQTWTPFPIAPPAQRFDGPGDSGGVSLTLGDADGTLSGYVDAGASFEGQTVTVYFSDLSRTTESGGDGTGSIPDEYVVESVTRGEGYLSLAMRSAFGTFDAKVPKRVMTRQLFPGLSSGPIV